MSYQAELGIIRLFDLKIGRIHSVPTLDC